MKILVVLSRVPYPLEKGDKLRAFYQIKELSKKHEIILFALNDSRLDKRSVTELKKYCSFVEIFPLGKLTILKNLARAVFSQKPFQVEYFYSKEANTRLKEIVLSYKPDHIYCQLIRIADYVKSFSSIPKTIDYMDVFSKGMARRITSAPWYLKFFANEEYSRLRKYEAEVFKWFNNKTIISEQDKSFIEHPDRNEIKIIPNGVDTNFFKPLKRKKDFDLLFNGNMSYPPNVESAEYIVKNVMPLILKRNPSIRFLISGTDPSEKILALSSENVVVTGWVDDIRENFAKARVLMAPMQISIGLQNKLLEAMAMKIPCITSGLANNALGAIPGKEILVAESPEEYVQHFFRLIDDEKFSEEIANNALQFVLKNFSWSENTSKLENIMIHTH